MSTRPLRLFNTLTREVSAFEPRTPPDVGMYSCGPTVYAYQHIGNMRAYVFADTLKRTLRWKGYDLHHWWRFRDGKVYFVLGTEDTALNNHLLSAD